MIPENGGLFDENIRQDEQDKIEIAVDGFKG